MGTAFPAHPCPCAPLQNLQALFGVRCIFYGAKCNVAAHGGISLLQQLCGKLGGCCSWQDNMQELHDANEVI